MGRIGVLVLLMTLAVLACKKYEDKPGVADLQNPYCNDPEAVNYNWGFPGKPDNSTCFYPDSIFAGTYIFQDTVYYSDNFVFARTQTDTFTISRRSPDSRLKLKLEWHACKISMDFTADRFYKATADTLFGTDTVFGGSKNVIRMGQTFCRQEDTLTGFVTKDRNDDKRVKVNFIVRTDTGSKVVYFTGTAIKK